MTKIILCADDSVTMQQVAEITFKGTDYSYVGARSADEALTKAKAQKPSLVLADAVMPGKTGYDLCQAIKGDPSLADVPVVVVTGKVEAVPGLQQVLGENSVFAKPFGVADLLARVAEITGGPGANGVDGEDQKGEGPL